MSNNIFDVAHLAGVSKSTVSRVINNCENIKPSTKAKVEAAMKELNYTPSYFAQSIRTRKAKTLALLVPEVSNLFYNELFNIIAEVAMQHGYLVLLCNVGQTRERILSFIQKLRQRNIDGIIYCVYQSSLLMDELIQISHQIPMVFVDYPNPQRDDISCLASDGLHDTAQIVKMFYDQGRKRIAFVGLGDIVTINYRYLGYSASLTACGYPFDKGLVYQEYLSNYSGEHFHIGYRAAQALMNRDEKPDAIVCGTDMLAIAVIRYLLENGYHIPQDVAVTGYDNISISSMVFPSLSTMAQPIHEMGTAAADILFKKIENNSYNKSLLLQSEFISRDST